MTRERHIAILRRVGRLDLETATKVVDRLLEELAIESEEDGNSVDHRLSPDVDKLAPPPIGEGSSILLDRMDRQKVREITAVPPTPQEEPTSNELQWSEVDLCSYLEGVIPKTMQVVPDGGKEPVELWRRIDPLLGLSLVKVTYSQKDANRPQASEQNRGGQTLERIAIDAAVTETFNCYQKEQPVQQKLDRIRESARQVFRPRPERIVSSTPIHHGELSFSDKTTPHDSV